MDSAPIRHGSVLPWRNGSAARYSSRSRPSTNNSIARPSYRTTTSCQPVGPISANGTRTWRMPCTPSLPNSNARILPPISRGEEIVDQVPRGRRTWRRSGRPRLPTDRTGAHRASWPCRTGSTPHRRPGRPRGTRRGTRPLSRRRRAAAMPRDPCLSAPRPVDVALDRQSAVLCRPSPPRRPCPHRHGVVEGRFCRRRPPMGSRSLSTRGPRSELKADE